MVRITEEIIMNPSNKRLIEAYGVSTDTKPTTNIITGSVFIEVDTGEAYLFNEANSTWVKVGAA